MATQNEQNDFQRNSDFEEDDFVSPQKQTRRGNLKNLWDNPRTRTMILATGIIFIILIAIGYHNINKPKVSEKTGGEVAVSAPPQIDRVPGMSTNATLNRDIAQQNQSGSQQALKQGSSYLPELHGASEDVRTDPLLLNPNPAPAASTASVAKTPAPVQVQQTIQQPVAVVQQRAPLTQEQVQAIQQLEQQRQQIYDQQMNYYLGRLRDHRSMTQYQEFAYNGQKPKANTSSNSEQNGNKNTSNNSSMSVNGIASSSKSKAPALIQAGTVIPSVLITPADSDSPGPLLVDITTGPFRGGRALCTAQTSQDTMGIHCSRLSLPPSSNIPGAGHSFQIDAYLVNANYETNLATSVNHHYLRNIGLLAASAFVQGYGQAVSRSNTTVTTGPFGSTVAYGSLSNAQIAKTALGQVGQSVSQQLEQQSNVPTTVKVEPKHPGEGVPCGLLFMSDF